MFVFCASRALAASAKKYQESVSQAFADGCERATSEEIAAPLRSTTIKTTLLINARETATGAPMSGLASEVKTASRTPMPPGTPITTKPMNHDDEVINSISRIPIFAPNAEAETEVESDIKIHEGMCAMASVTKRRGSVRD